MWNFGILGYGQSIHNAHSVDIAITYSLLLARILYVFRRSIAQLLAEALLTPIQSKRILH